MHSGNMYPRLAGISLMGALLAGCAAAPSPMAQMTFDRAVTAGSPVAIAPAAIGAPQLAPAPSDLAASTALAASSRSGGGSQQAASGHRLRVDLGAFLATFSAPAQRRLLATTADIDKLVLTVMQAGLPDQTATLTREQIASGVADFTFSELPAGNAIVFVVAYDAAGLPIGSAAQVVVISETASSVAELTVQLVPSSATGGPGGTLVTKTTFLDGPPPSPQPAGTVLMELDTLGVPHELNPAPGGGMFVSTHLLNQQMAGNIKYAFFNTTVRVAEDGTELDRYIGLHSRPATQAYSPSTGQLWLTWGDGRLIQPDGTNTWLGVNVTRIALDSVGNAYGTDTFLTAKPIYKVTPAGVKTMTSMTGHRALTVDAVGNLWTTWADGAAVATSLRRYAPNETLLGTHPVPGHIRQIDAAPSGEIWVIHEAAGTTTNPYFAEAGPSSSHVSKLAADGTLLGTYAVSARRLAFDANGDVWVAGDTLTKLSSNGQVLASYPQDCWSVAVDDLGYIWTGAKKANGMPAVKKLQP